VTDHGVPPAANAGAIAAARRFFSLPEDAKHSCYTGKAARGWTPPGENLTASAEFVKQAAPSLQQK
jgi:isopenicillin N synthase-like dioxygenase